MVADRCGGAMAWPDEDVRESIPGGFGGVGALDNRRSWNNCERTGAASVASRGEGGAGETAESGESGRGGEAAGWAAASRLSWAIWKKGGDGEVTTLLLPGGNNSSPGKIWCRHGG